MSRLLILAAAVALAIGLSSPAGVQAQELKINELRYDDASTDNLCFVEIKGPGGTSLDGYFIRCVNGYNGEEYLTFDLTGQTIPADGYFVMAQTADVPNADWVPPPPVFDPQNGPDNVVLTFGTDPVDAIGYETFSPAEFFVGEGSPAPGITNLDELSLQRCPDGSDSDDNSVDFVVAMVSIGVNNDPCITPTPVPPTNTPTPTPTIPGSPTQTPTPTPTRTPTPVPSGSPYPPPDVVINELLYNDAGTDNINFIELLGPPGMSLDGFSIVGINGAQPSCEDDFLTVDLTGFVIPEDGLFVIAQSVDVPNYDYIPTPAFDPQNGPDNMHLYYMGEIVDTLGYGSFTPDNCNMSEGGQAAADCNGDVNCLGRCPDGLDTNNNAFDFQCLPISPGELNCPVYSPTPVVSPTETPLPTETMTPMPTTEPGTPTRTPTLTVTPEPTYTPTSTGVPQIIINELGYNDADEDDLCFIELAGQPGAPLDGVLIVAINGGVVDCSDVTYMYLLNGYAIGPDGYFVLARNESVGLAEIYDPMFDPQNGPDNIQLRYGETVLDSLGYGNFQGGAECNLSETAAARNCSGDTVSLSRCPDSVDTNDNDRDFMCVERSVHGPNNCTPPTPTPTPIVSPTDTPTTGPTATPTDVPPTNTPTTVPPTNTPTTVPPTNTPTPTTVPPTETPEPTAPACTTLGVEIEFNTDYVSPGEPLSCMANVCSPDGPLANVPFFALLDINVGEFWFYPSWAHYPPDIDWQYNDFAEGMNHVQVLQEFAWPDTGQDSFGPIFIHGAMLNAEMSELSGALGSDSFTYGP